MDIKITRAKISDAKQILEVKKQTWLATYPNKRYKISRRLILSMDFQSTTAIKKMRKSLKRKDVKIWVAKIKSEVVGYGTARKYPDSNYLGSLYILPAYQNQGLGKKIMQKIFHWLGNEKAIVLQVAKYNKQATNFYKKLGFKVIGKSESVPVLPDGRKIPSVEMKKYFKSE